MLLKHSRVLLESAAVVLASTLCAFLAIYDSGKMPFGARFLFWLSLIGVGSVLATWLRPLVYDRFLSDRPIWLKRVTLGALVSLPIPLMLLGFDTGFQHGWPLSNWITQYVLSLVIASIYLLIRDIAFERDMITALVSDQDDITDILTIRKFLERLPKDFHEACLHAVSAEDHYLRIHTDVGSDLILMRLSDAMHELGRRNGVQTHRSWWVAKEGVVRSTSADGKHVILLKCGTVAPVARSRTSKVHKTLKEWML